MELLRFKSENAKLSNTLIFSLPAGHTCPAAVLCRAAADRVTGKVTDGEGAKFRCFGASCEALSTDLRKLVWRNYELVLKASREGVSALADLIDASMPDTGGLVRIHSTGGDFFSRRYLAAWLEVARRRPGYVTEYNGKPQVIGTVFYAYTKMIPFFVGLELPENFKVVASFGGAYDELIVDSGLRKAVVVLRESEAEAAGLEIDHDDTHAWAYDRDFALVIHGTQPAGSDASKARQENRKAGKFTGYGKKVKV
jgi:hypothetical protein